MRAKLLPGLLVGSLGLLLFVAKPGRGDEIPAEYRNAINKGLEWLAKNQHKDGHWAELGEQYPMTMTALGGMAMLMEGSTIREGKYKDHIRRAADWLMARSLPNGMLGNPNIPGEAGRYMYGHGFSLMFLSCIYGEEEEGDRRKKLEDILVRAAKFSRDAQTNRGGWGYVSAREGGNFDEGSVTVTQVQALRAARNAGIAVPADAIKDAQKYLQDSTNAQGGVIYSLANGGGGPGSPALTSAAISCGFSFGDYNSPLVKKWFKFCQQHLGTLGAGRAGHDEYTHYYYAQAVYMLGEDGWDRLYPGTKDTDKVTWKKYRKATFDNLVRMQGADGSWNGGHAGPVFATACHLTMMQLDKAVLPLYQR
jgi:hypothetical protein